MRTEVQIQDRIQTLLGLRQRRRDYMRDCDDTEDWHGVQDAASDLREFDTELRVLEWVLQGE